MAELNPQGRDDIREIVRDRYAGAARAVVDGNASCCDPPAAGEGSQSCGCAADPIGGEQGFPDFGADLYSSEDRDALPEHARLASLGCGNPTAVADLHEGETVLDLGSGGGIDVLLSARRVGPRGKVYGLDMTDEMLALARRNQREAGIDNAEFVRGTIEEIPLPDGAVDVVISNCVINLSGDKPSVFREAARVLRPGGRFAVTDVVADAEMDEATRRDMAQWTGCIAGALTVDEYRAQLEAAGFTDVGLRETHRVHEHAGSAIIRARKPPRSTSDPSGPRTDVAPAECRLDLSALRRQRERYRTLGRHVTATARRPDALVVQFGPEVDERLLDEALTVERECCPFFRLEYESARHKLSVSVDPEHEPALAAVAYALLGEEGV